VKTHLAYVGIGSNAGDRAENLARALAALRDVGKNLRCSSIYRTAPWGRTDQLEFLNAVASIETASTAHALLDQLLDIERGLGRVAGERWGPRVIDLDLLLYDEVTIADERLRVPHEHLAQRAFVLVPLCELDERFSGMRDALQPSELAGVVRIDKGARARFGEGSRENVSMMSSEVALEILSRARALANFLSTGDAVRLRIERGEEEIELVRRSRRAPEEGRGRGRGSAEAMPARIESIRADLVGIFHLKRPAPERGETFDGDLELGYIEALGIRTSVHSMGAGRLVAIETADESPVEYGQPLFLIARG
jgi:2-amino-4-hydroxy-6-hydroxymethyldihydropteridine diphosphokinase